MGSYMTFSKKGADLTIRFIDCFIYVDPSLVKIIIVDANCSLPEIFILRVI